MNEKKNIRSYQQKINEWTCGLNSQPKNKSLYQLRKPRLSSYCMVQNSDAIFRRLNLNGFKLIKTDCPTFPQQSLKHRTHKKRSRAYRN